MSLQSKLDAFKADFKSGKPPYNAPAEIHPIMERATKALVESGQASNALRAGEKAPIFSLSDQDGNMVSSNELLKHGPLVISFYRGVWCPYCNLELQALNEAYPTILQYGASLLAISPQNMANSRKSIRSNGLKFPVLNDQGNQLADVFGIRYELPKYLVELYKKLKNELPVFNNDSSWTLPIPARYVIGTDGTILYSEVNPDYTQRPEPEELYPVLEKASQLTA